MSDPNGLVTFTGYDELDRALEIVAGFGSGQDLTTSYGYNAFGDLELVTLPRGNSTKYLYDAAGRLEEIHRLDASAQPLERTVHEHDVAGNRAFEHSERWDSGLGDWQRVTTTKYEYASRCELEQVTRGFGAIGEQATTEYVYDCSGRLTKVWDAEHDSTVDPPREYEYQVRLDWTVELEGAVVFLDGREVKPEAGKITVSAGQHEVRIEKPGNEPIVRHLDLGPEDRGDQSLDLREVELVRASDQ